MGPDMASDTATPTTPARPARPTGSLSPWEGMARQYDYWLTVLKRTWRGGVVSSFLTPLLYVVAMGVAHSVKDLVVEAFSHAGLDWEQYVRTDPRFLRPAEVDHLIGDPAKAKRVLGWEPSVDFKGLVHMMVDADIERHSRDRSAAAVVR